MTNTPVSQQHSLARARVVYKRPNSRIRLLPNATLVSFPLFGTLDRYPQLESMVMLTYSLLFSFSLLSFLLSDTKCSVRVCKCLCRFHVYFIFVPQLGLELSNSQSLMLFCIILILCGVVILFGILVCNWPRNEYWEFGGSIFTFEWLSGLGMAVTLSRHSK